MLLEVECDRVEDGIVSETSMKGFAMNPSISEMVSLGGKREKIIGLNFSWQEVSSKEILLIKDEVGLVDGFGRICKGVILGLMCTHMAWDRSKV